MTRGGSAYESNITILSKMQDKNTFHFFARNVYEIWRVMWKNSLMEKNVTVVLAGHDPLDIGNCWHMSIVKAVVGPKGNVVTRYRQNKAFDFVLSENSWMFECWKYVKYKPCPCLMALAHRINESLGIVHKKEVEKRLMRIVLIQRKASRIMYDSKTRMELSSVLENKFDHLSTVYFDNATLQTQSQIIASADIVIACHGAALTNMIFLPPHGQVIEVSFRGQPCWTKRKKPYHKADFHNMAGVFAKGFFEVPAEWTEGAMDATVEFPEIGFENVYVSARKISNSIRIALDAASNWKMMKTHTTCEFGGWAGHPCLQNKPT